MSQKHKVKHYPIRYSCKECGAKAEIIAETIRRCCKHSGAPIIADMKATAYGVGSTEQ